VIDNHAQRSFAEADVNTVITVMHSPDKSDVKTDHTLRFVAFRKPFAEIAFSGAFIKTEGVKEKEMNDTLRTIVKSYEELITAGSDESGKYKGEKWGGKFLRAPLFYLTWLEEKKDKLSSIEDLCNKGLVDVVGYVHDNKTGSEYSQQFFIKSIKNTEKILINENSEGVIKYGVSNNGNSLVTSPILFPRTFGRDHIVVYNPEGIIGKEFYRVIPKNVCISEEDLIGFFNSTFYILQRELNGLNNLGGGALKFSIRDIKFTQYIKSIEIKNNFNLINFVNRKTENLFVECGIDPGSDTPISEQEPEPLPDRKELDDILFDELGLTEEERKDVYRAVCQLVHDRISKASSV